MDINNIINTSPMHRGSGSIQKTFHCPKHVSVFHKILSDTNGSQLKFDGWKTMVPFWDGLFSEANSQFLGNVFTTKNIRQHDGDSKIRLNKKNLWQTSSRCLVANFRDRVLRASALDDTQNSLHKHFGRDFSRSPHWWDPYRQGILNSEQYGNFH